ncbi:MAG: DUF302 domain-containing protein [Armatimonadota bacterium]|nr:DUF302 domain-containing protein [Armatimonadota bacterium]
MNRKTVIRIAIGALSLLLGTTTTTLARSHSGTPDYTRRVARPFQQVMSAVKTAAKEYGFHISGQHDIAASIRKAGLQRSPYTVIEVCNPRIAAEVLKAEPRLGAFMPCRIAVFQQGNTTVVTTVFPSRLAALFHSAQAMRSARQIDHNLRLIIQDAVR